MASPAAADDADGMSNTVQTGSDGHSRVDGPSAASPDDDSADELMSDQDEPTTSKREFILKFFD